MPFDPDAAARPDSGLFGLSCMRDEAKIVVLPVPYEATTSYRAGTANGPAGVLEASRQVDLYDRLFGRIYEKGIHMPEAPAWIRTLSDQTRRVALPLIEKGGAEGGDAAAVQAVDAAGRRIEEHVRGEAAAVLQEGKVPALLGGEHSISYGAIAACAAAHGPIGVLQIDAHMDLRERFEGFETSHASIMHRVITTLPQVTRLVQVGIRDFGEGEWGVAREHGAEDPDGRVRVFFDDDIAQRTLAGGSFKQLCDEAVGALPDCVYVSFDIDGLDPALCPHTGTPVPGGLSFQQASAVLAALKASGRRVVGFDLVEVAPGPRADEPEWDANVGARVLYRLCGVASGLTAPA